LNQILRRQPLASITVQRFRLSL